MFKQIGYVAARYRYLIIAVWVALAAIITIAAPPLDEVVSSDWVDFLPDNAPFLAGEKVLAETFPGLAAPGSTYVVIDAGEAGSVNDPAVWQFVGDLEAWLNSDAAPSSIARVTAPTSHPLASQLLVSQDQQVALVAVDLNTGHIDPATGHAIDAIDRWLSEHRPANVVAQQTGASPVVITQDESIRTSVERTIWVTIVLVIVLLLAIYRSPVSPLIPLITVTLSYLVSAGLVAWIGQSLMTVISYVKVLLVVVLYGAGTDYCLFLINRFREELADEPQVTKATRSTMERVGETIASSAGTIFVGFVAMAFAEMGLFNSSGPALAVGIAVMLAAGLTLAPALMATLGERTFWPGRGRHNTASNFYRKVSVMASKYPVVTVLIIAALMAPFSIHGLGLQFGYNPINDLPENKPSVAAFKTLGRHMDQGDALPLDIVVTGRDAHTVAADIVRLTAEIGALDGIASVRGMNSPFGQGRGYENLLRVDVQIGLILETVDSLQVDQLDASSALTMLTNLKTYVAVLAARFPEVAQDEDMLSVQNILSGNALQVLLQREELATAATALQARFAAMPDAYLLPSSAGDLFADAQPIAELYLAPDETAYRLQAILKGAPTSYAALDTVGQVRELLAAHQGAGEAVASGDPAMLADIRDTIQRDQLRTYALVLGGIFVVLLIMLRSAVAPIYLLLTVVLTFTTALGITELVFGLALGVERLTFWMPFFAFVFLVAVGIDYSIFLMGRVKEEVAQHGPHEGIHRAVAATGGIITSAGIILAGTFASVMTAEIKGLVEIGFAVSLGVLIDTFIVRTMLVPAITTMLGRWAWWPGGLPRKQ